MKMAFKSEPEPRRLPVIPVSGKGKKNDNNKVQKLRGITLKRHMPTFYGNTLILEWP